ncbi:MAG: hypothetical protein EBU81_13870, partial [Proteobacteria bacterium]|nr:hypothetical protein [Pseudomonadota bacterium]
MKIRRGNPEVSASDRLRIRLNPSYWKHLNAVPFSEDVVPSSLFLRNSHYLVVDLETQNLVDDVGGWGHIDKLKISIACAFDSKTQQMLTFRENEIGKLNDLCEERLVIGYNIRGFDLLLGNEADTFRIDARPIDNLSLTTRLSLGDGNDTVTITALPGPTTVLGGAGSDQVVIDADESLAAELLGGLVFDGNAEIYEQTVGLNYVPSFHDPIVAAVPSVVTGTAGSTVANPTAQFKEKLLSAARTAHVAVRGTFSAVSGGAGVDVLDRPLDVFWTRVEVALTGIVA